MKIMFVCTGNICRSAMAHWLMVKKLNDLDRKDVEVYSCGIYAQNGDTSTYNDIEAMKEYGVDLKEHRATNISKSRIEEMDLILCATRGHKFAILDKYPKLENKVYTMKEYVGYNREYHNSIDIKDPWGYDLEIFRFCASEINECLDLLLTKL